MAGGFLFLLMVILAVNAIVAEHTRKKPTFLIRTCNTGYKQCLQTETMEVCAVLLEECKETKKFKQPEPITKDKPEKQKPLIFNGKSNKVNLRRCK